MLPNDNHINRTIRFIAWHTDKTGNEMNQNWWIRLTDLQRCVSPIHEFVHFRFKSAAIFQMAALDIEHFRENMLIMSIHDS